MIDNEVGERMLDGLRYGVLKNWDTEKLYHKEMKEQILGQTSFIYPHLKEKEIPVKISVSELKRLEMARLEKINEDNLWDDVNVDGNILSECEWTQKEDSELGEMPRPVFLAGEKELSGAGKGTLYHLAM